MNSPAVNYKNLWKPLFVAAALAFLFANVLAKLGKDWWTDENYSHGLLVPFVIGLIVWIEFDELKNAAAKPQILLGGIAIFAAFTLLLGGTLGAELFTQRVSFVVMCAGIIVYFFGAKIIKSLVVPFVLLLLAIPIPQIIFNKIAFPLQIWASQTAVWGIRLFGVPTIRKGNVIEILPFGATQIIALEVVEACSGIRSLMTLVTLALILAYFTREKTTNEIKFWQTFDFWRTIILMAAAIPIAVLTNAARVTATGVLTYYYGRQATESSVHEVSGWLVYVVALVLLIGLNALLKTISRKVAKSQSESEGRTESETESESGKISASSRLSVSASRICALCLVLVAGGVFVNWFERRGEVAVERKSLIEMPQQIGDWRMKGGEIRFDKQTESVLRADDYTMREYLGANNRLANVYVGFYASQKSGATYHSPQNCLPGAGWTMREPEQISITTPAGKTFTANRYIIENGVYKEVLIYWYQGRGRIAASEYADKLHTITDSVLRRRSDGAMVRVMTDLGADVNASNAAAINLSAALEDELSPFIPD